MVNDIVTPSSPLGPMRSARAGRLVWLLVIALIAAVVSVVYMAVRQQPAVAPAATDSQNAQTPAAPASAPAAAVTKLAPAGEEAAPAPPPLEQSDAVLREAIVDGAGQAGMRLLRETDIVRRLVASIDNLTRAKVPRSIWIFKPVPGSFVVDATATGFTIGAGNDVRYRPYVELVTSINTSASVRLYRRYAAWFETTYRMLGYPDGGFDARLLAAIDDLLDTPDPPEPIALVQPKVLFQFADPELERLSAGQKMLIRMGPQNRAAVEQKLRELRRELAREDGKASDAAQPSGAMRQ
ncbi:MAG TPA: DUF3014 domain-containing protein [Casimicrobiaceae bacterium]|nr:DUF3014 domain-containing protein [Casimicrobiaceae bacterium]